MNTIAAADMTNTTPISSITFASLPQISGQILSTTQEPIVSVTIETIQAKQTELSAMIKALQEQAEKITYIEIDEATIELRAGERYAGAILDEDGDHVHHLVLMAQRPDEKLTWQAAIDWAASVGGSLPSRQEQALLYANCKPHLKPEWHWSCETYKDDASYSWYCYFGYNYQNYSHKSFEGSAVAVRRV